MKEIKVLIWVSMVFFFYSCVSLESYYVENYQVNVPIKTFVGGEMFSIDSGYRDKNTGQILSGFKQQLIYAGIQESALQIYYREFSSSKDQTIIRDAFTLRLVYDIAESDTIRFRNNLILVLSANSSEIIFKLLNDNIISSRSNDSTPIINKNRPIPKNVRPPNAKHKMCAEKYLIREHEGLYIVPSEEAYWKYVECRPK